MEQILRQDAADQLDRQRGLRLLELRIRPSYAAAVADADAGLGAALAATAAVGSAEVVGVVLQAEPRTRAAQLAQDVLAGARRLARRPDLRDNATRFKVNGIGPDGLVEPINVLSDALVSVQQVARLRRMSCPVSSRRLLILVEDALEGSVIEGVVVDAVVPAAPAAGWGALAYGRWARSAGLADRANAEGGAVHEHTARGRSRWTGHLT
jgi:hypothetical protein